MEHAPTALSSDLNSDNLHSELLKTPVPPLDYAVLENYAVLESLTPDQWAAVDQLVTERAAERRPKPRPKLIDIRFVMDLVITRFYVVLMVGQDRRGKDRSHAVTGLTKLGNILAAFFLLLGANLVISAFVILGLYLTKSALGFDFGPGHITQQIEGWLK